MAQFSSRLLERYKELLPDAKDFESYLKISKKKFPKIVRINSLKANAEQVKAWMKERHLEFTEIEGFPHALQLHNVWLLMGGIWETRNGFIHAQELASQIPARVLNPKPGELVLDMAAAPGNKTSQMAEMMHNQGTIIAVEKNKERCKSLRYLLNRLGVANAIVCMQDATNLPEHFQFDKILLDAPCSGEGLLRKKAQALKGWTEKLVQQRAELQVQLLSKAVKLLRPGGEVVYSVCTLSPEECEGVLTTILKAHPEMKIVKCDLFGLKTRPGMKSFRNRVFAEGMEHTHRLFPQDNNTQSFFVAKLVKDAHPHANSSHAKEARA
jgi:NOL1/NOP2/sun family putative RNA methylase